MGIHARTPRTELCDKELDTHFQTLGGNLLREVAQIDSRVLGGWS